MTWNCFVSRPESPEVLIVDEVKLKDNPQSIFTWLNVPGKGSKSALAVANPKPTMRERFAFSKKKRAEKRKMAEAENREQKVWVL